MLFCHLFTSAEIVLRSKFTRRPFGGLPFRRANATLTPKSQQQVPHRTFGPVRNDKELSGDSPTLFSTQASEDLQGGAFFLVVGLYDDLHVLVEGDQEAQKALDGKLAEVAAQHLGDIGLADAEQGGGLDLFEAALLDDRVDFED
jgi:hypothetical protein